MNAIGRVGAAGAALAVLVGCGPATPASAQPTDQLHNITYLARVDGVAPGAQATFRITDTATNRAPLSALPGNVFEAHTVLADPGKAGMQISVPWPYSPNVHCEIEVDDAVTVQLDQVVSGKPGTDGVLSCGAPLTGG